MSIIKWVRAAALFASLAGASAQAQKDPEEAAVIEIGASAGRNLKDSAWSFGPSAAVEVTPIEKWLELEAGVTPGFGRHTTEWSADLLFKKPWTLSRTLEFMAGIGPEWIHARQSGATTNSIAGEAVLDFMFWPGRWKHRFGGYVEPGYEYDFGPGHERSLGVSFGFLIAIRKH